MESRQESLSTYLYLLHFFFPGYCPSGWPEYDDGNCYFYSSERKIYNEAEQDCVQRGGHLTSILSQAENNFHAG